MIEKVRLQTKMLLPLSLLIVVVLVLTASMLSGKYAQGRALLDLKENMKLITEISSLVHATQKERGMSSGYLASRGEKFKRELLMQREITNQRAKELQKMVSLVSDKKVAHRLKWALEDIERLKDIRKEIDTIAIKADKSIEFFSEMNDRFLKVITTVSKTSNVPEITQTFTAYNNFLYAKENAGMERAVGTAILANGHYSDRMMKIYFIGIIATQAVYTKIFINYASPNVVAYYQRISEGKVFQEVQRIREIILYDANYHKIAPEYWFEKSSYKINQLQGLNGYIEAEILQSISQALDKTYRLFGVLVFLNILSIISFFLMIVWIIQLMRSEKRLKKVTDRYIISSTTDTKGRIKEVSDAFCAISGYKREELIGKPHNIIRHPDMPKSAFREMWATIQQGKSWSGRVKNLTKEGGYYWVYANIEPLFDRKNRIEGYAAVRLDITDSIHLEEELKRSKEKDETLLHQSKLAQMGEMISMIAHQWRQPLTAISSTSNDMYMKILLKQYEEKYFLQKLEKINEFSKHLSQTIDDFRNFYKKDKEHKVVTYSEIVKGAFDIIATSLINKNIELRSEFKAQKEINVLVNELRQVILNLMKNAEDVLLEREIDTPYIFVSTYDDDAYSYLEIRDNGGGIHQAHIQTVFDPYFSTKMKKDGTGLGLYMSKIIVEDHCHGRLFVVNGEEGAVFTIQIPLFNNDEQKEVK